MKPQQGELVSARRLKDRSVNVMFNLNELPSQDFLEIDDEIGQFGVVYFAQKEALTDAEKKAIDNATIEINGKSESKKLMSILYCFAKQEGLDFEQFYKKEMFKIQEHYKNKLKPLS